MEASKEMRKLLPYSLPLLFGLLFVGTAHTNRLWISLFLIFLTGRLTPVVGEFSRRQLIAEFAFFHHSLPMARFKTLNGIFFVLLNGWAFYFLATESLPLWRLIVFIYGMVILNSNFAMSLAHDLMHARSGIDRRLSEILLLQNGFFYLEADHLYIHHRHVGTRHDPATARLGESIYRYLIRSLTGRMKLLFGQNTAFSTQKSRSIRRLTKLKLFICMFYLLLGAFVSGQVFGWMLSQYLFVILVYESITYIQHYAMQRTPRDGGYEPVQLHHAWNSFYKLNAYLYFMMPVHSLHHVHDPGLSRVGADAGPRMPLPFARMLLTAYRPTRWFRLMNKQALSFRQDYQPTPP